MSAGGVYAVCRVHKEIGEQMSVHVYIESMCAYIAAVWSHSMENMHLSIN